MTSVLNAYAYDANPKNPIKKLEILEPNCPNTLNRHNVKNNAMTSIVIIIDFEYFFLFFTGNLTYLNYTIKRPIFQ